MKNKITISLLCATLVLSGIILMPNAFAESIPDWVKNTAGWWATDAISETEFLNAIEFLVKENIILVDASQTSETSQGVPGWVKNTAGWWATDVISETEFVNAIAYLIKIGIISIESSKSPELIAEMWINGNINDDEFLANVEQLIENNVITIQSDSITKTSQLPDWLVNNAGWWAARILTNSDFEFNPGYVKEEIYPCIEFSTDSTCFARTYNSYSFRGNEFQEQKHDIDFRIFTVGGSTTYGVAAEDDETWPAYLQQIISEKTTGKKIEVINSGVSGANTESEYDLIKNKIASLDPDLIIMYDGWNDHNTTPVKKTIQNWKSVCKLGKIEGFDTIIVVQPLPLTGYRVLTEQEITNSFLSFPYIQNIQQYVDAFEELDKICTKTADFSRIFDYIQEPIFWDTGHTTPFGNKIIAQNIFSVISPIYFDETYSVIHNDLQIGKNKPETGVVYAVGADLSGKNFDNLNLQNAVFDKTDLSNTSFKNTNIDGARFVFANLNNSNLLDRTDLSNINLAGTDLSNVSLKGKDLSGANLSFVDLSEHDLTETNLSGVNLSHAKLSKVTLKLDLSGANLSFVDLSEHDLTGTSLSDTFLMGTNLSGIDLRPIPLTNADFRHSDLSDTKLLDSLLVNNNFDHALLKNINFAGKNLSSSSFHQANFDGSDLQNTNLFNTRVDSVDFTKIKDKSLAGADLSSASFAHSNLSGINLAGTNMDMTNFWKANLSGQDFTNNVNIYGTVFLESNLSNANFEGMDIFNDELFTTPFKNKAYLKILSNGEIKIDIFGKHRQIFILSTEISGNDLIVKYIIYTNFAGTNLENANFKNADLKFTNFYQANLTNADLSGADLRKAFLGEADLSNANLEGANLEDATLDNAILSNANLKCINHPICVSG